MTELLLTRGRVETAWWGPPPDAAPTLVLLHEGLGCVKLWRDFPIALQAATGFGVFAYSRFGYGGSDPIALPRPMTYMHEEALEVLPEVLDRSGIRKAILIGHSDGGSIAAIHAGATQDPRLLGIAMMAAHFIVEDLNIAAIRQIKQTYETGDLRARLARYHADVDGAFYGWNGAWLDPRFRQFYITGYLEAIRVPICALQGTDDPYGTDEQLRVLERHASADTRLVANARHSPHLEAPAETLAVIAAFARSLQPEGSS
jgi:pimeloyl-ACP methyl ester carboxylesterase